MDALTMLLQLLIITTPAYAIEQTIFVIDVKTESQVG